MDATVSGNAVGRRRHSVEVGTMRIGGSAGRDRKAKGDLARVGAQERPAHELARQLEAPARVQQIDDYGVAAEVGGEASSVIRDPLGRVEASVEPVVDGLQCCVDATAVHDRGDNQVSVTAEDVALATSDPAPSHDRPGYTSV